MNARKMLTNLCMKDIVFGFELVIVKTVLSGLLFM